MSSNRNQGKQYNSAGTVMMAPEKVDQQVSVSRFETQKFSHEPQERCDESTTLPVENERPVGTNERPVGTLGWLLHGLSWRSTALLQLGREMLDVCSRSCRRLTEATSYAIGSPSGLGLLRQASYFSSPGPGFESFDSGIVNGAPPLAKVIAFYLPQFHPIPENDKWWGEGFTEWRNVTRALPRFLGHHQPRLPQDLGFYDLRTPGVIERQVELAKNSGIFGFCFYYYFFNGKRILEDPLDRFVSDSSIDFPFCLTWANENWTRRWDGLDEDVLLEQGYDDKFDELLVADLARYFSNSNYIRINGRPLLCIYRPHLIPRAAEAIVRWRKMFRDIYGEEPYVLMTQSFASSDPRQFGLDGAIEFPPNNPSCLGDRGKIINRSVPELDPDFAGKVFRYSDLVDKSISRTRPDFDLIRTVVPSWDNEARQPNRGVCYTGSTPQEYGRWLSEMIGHARKNPFQDEPFVFVNAWNEWAEGAYLEPDVHWGAAYLNATARAVCGKRQKELPLEDNLRLARGISKGQRKNQKAKILVIGHDAYLHGAQMICLNIVRHLKKSFGVEVTVVLLDEGPLEREFKELCPTYVIRPNEEQKFLKLIDQLHNQGYTWAMCNTVVSGMLTEPLHRAGFRVVSLVHELSKMIEERRYKARCATLARFADSVVFPAQTVQKSFEELVGPLGARAAILPQGSNANLIEIADARTVVIEELGIPADSKIVINIGFGDLRKGLDLFQQLAKLVSARNANFHFLWVGDIEKGFEEGFAQCGNNGNLHHIPFKKDVDRYLQAADVFALTSREDPFPTVVVEALCSGVPVVAFEGGGGTVEMLSSPLNGRLTPFLDVERMAVSIESIAADETMFGTAARATRAEAAKSKYDSRRYAFSLLQLFDPAIKPVLVVVPNYNYGNYLQERLESIFNQSYPIYELIVADDASTDNSLAVLERIRAVSGRDFKIISNERNSGSVFRQWSKGAQISIGEEFGGGELLWIAEADDSCCDSFLRELSESMLDPSVNIAFSNSRQINGKGVLLAESYDYYYNDVEGADLLRDFTMPGDEFLKKCLAVKNVILNVSSVLFRKTVFMRALNETADELDTFRVAGDWRLYIEICKAAGNVSYLSRPLNTHRRHETSVTHSLDHGRHLDEIGRIHNIVASSCSAEISTKQSSYLKQVQKQFAQQALSVGGNL